MRSIELLGTKVAPAVRQRAEDVLNPPARR